MLPSMNAKDTDVPKTISETDRRIIAAMTAAVEHRGMNLTELGRQMGFAHSTWARKRSTDPKWHHRFSAEEVEQIARALDLPIGDLYSGSPVLLNH